MLGVLLVFGFKIILSCFLFDEESDNDFPSHSLFPNKISCKRLVHRFTITAEILTRSLANQLSIRG